MPVRPTHIYLSSLAKVTDWETLKLVMKSAVQPLVQMNVPEGFLDPVKDKELQTSEQELTEKVEKTILPRHQAACFKHKLKNGPMRILAAAVWLKLKRKYFLEGMAKEACELFQVRAKQLSRVLMGCKYLGGKNTPAQKGKKRKDSPLLIPPRGPRRAETTGANHSTNADHLLFYARSLKIVSSITIAAEMHSSHQVHKSPQRHGISIHLSHHSPFTAHCSLFQYRQHIVGSFMTASQLPPTAAFPLPTVLS